MHLLFFATILTGCQTSVDEPVERISNFYLEEEITKLEVVEWETEKLVQEITDEAFIQELIAELENADSLSTASMDFESPDYRLFFLNGEELVYEIGYSNSAMNVGIISRYWDYQKDGFYGIRLKLPLNE